MILMVFLLAPTVPSDPRPQKIARTTSGPSMSKRVVRQAGVRDIVLDADGEVVLGLFAGKVVEDALDHRRA